MNSLFQNRTERNQRFYSLSQNPNHAAAHNHHSKLSTMRRQTLNNNLNSRTRLENSKDHHNRSSTSRRRDINSNLTQAKHITNNATTTINYQN